MALTSADIMRGGYALNPATGKYELVYAKAPDDYLTGDYSDYSFDPTGRQSLAGYAPGYYTDNGSFNFADFLKHGAAVVGSALGGGVLASGLGAGALGGEAVGAAGGTAAAGGSAAAGGDLAGIDVLGGVEGVGGAGSGLAATGGAAPAAGEPMWDWLDTVDLGGPEGVGGEDLSYLNDIGGAEGLGGSYEDTGWMDGLGGPEGLGGLNAGATQNDEWWRSLYNGASKLGSTGAAALQRYLGGGRSAAAGGSGPGGMGLGEAAFDSTPFILAAALANKQRGDINPYIDRLNSLNDQFAGNQPAFLKSITDPYDMATSAQSGQLTSRLGQRGVLGSSFGNMDLDNFNFMRDVGRGNLLSQATAQGIGAQSQLTDQAMKAINTRNAGSNALLGAGLNASARLFAPQRDPFGLNELMKMAGG